MSVNGEKCPTRKVISRKPTVTLRGVADELYDKNPAKERNCKYHKPKTDYLSRIDIGMGISNICNKLQSEPLRDGMHCPCHSD